MTIPLQPCRCFDNFAHKPSGVQCVPMPNRFRKPLEWKRFWDPDYLASETGELIRNFTHEDAMAATARCNEAIAAELGPGYSAGWCVANEPVILKPTAQ